MANTTFNNRQTVITSEWCNEVNDLVHEATVPASSSLAPGAANKILYSVDAVTVAWSSTLPASIVSLIDHGSLSGLSDDDHTQYHNDARALTWLGTRSTTDLPEGTNLYYTDERAQDAIGAMVGTSIVYNDAGATLQRAALTGDITAAQNSNATTLATVNSNVGSFGSASSVGTFTVNGKGLITAASNTTISTTSTAITDFTEAAQDAIGAMIDSSLTYVDGTPLLQRAALTGDITASAGSNATTLATVNSNVGSFGSATAVGTFTVNGKGLITAASSTTISTTSSAITDFTEAAQDAVGAMVGTSIVYNDAGATLQRAALTGDITASQDSNATTLATVNSNVGSFGTAGATGTFTVNGKGLITAASNTSIDHGSIGGLSDDDHTQYALLAGRSGGQTLIGGTAASNSLTLQTTSNVTKGSYILTDLTSNGFVKTSGGTGTLSIDTTSYQTLDATLTALAAYNTNGILTQTAADTFTGRTITGTANEITLTNGDGVSGNPTVSIPSSVTFTGKTITGGTYASVAQMTVDNIDINGNTVSSTSGNVTITPVAGSNITLDTNVTIDGGVVAITGDLSVDNININGNTIISTNANGNVTIDPNGTGNVVLGNYTFDGDQTVGAGQDNYVMTYDNATGLISLEANTGGSGLANIVEDLTPQLGGDLDANGFDIQFDNSTGIRDDSDNEQLIFEKTASAANYWVMTNSSTGNNIALKAGGSDTDVSINILPKGTGNILLGTLPFNGDQTVGAGQDNYVLTYDNGTGLINLEASAGGSKPTENKSFDAADFYAVESAFASLELLTGSNVTTLVRAFDDTTQEYVNGKFQVPSDLDTSGTITLRAYVSAATAAASKNIELYFNHCARADGESYDPTSPYTNVASGATSIASTQGYLTLVTWTVSVSTAAWSANDLVMFKLSRNPSATNDLTGDLYLFNFTVSIPRA